MSWIRALGISAGIMAALIVVVGGLVWLSVLASIPGPVAAVLIATGLCTVAIKLSEEGR
jgi:hypothetical protein